MTGSDDLDRRFRDAFGDRSQRNAPLAPHTTFKVGGAADWLLTLHGTEELRQALQIAAEFHVPVRVLGGGSNVLVSDRGVPGLVIRLRGANVTSLDPNRVRAGAALTINGLVRWTINRGVAGLEAWAGTPGTVGGAIFGNAHFQGRNIGELVDRVLLMDRSAALLDVPASEMEFGYDFSRIQRTGELVVSADFRVSTGDPAALRATARESLAFRKRTQPLESASAGCIFQNPVPARDRVPDGIPWSAGALVDRAGLKGASEGRARVSTTHANFIVNEGGATSAEVRALIERCKAAVRERFGVELREEIVYLGFD
jgi:UDP-N-acetylmuramate dehydrogenase